jgi:hypothetical protein
MATFPSVSNSKLKKKFLVHAVSHEVTIPQARKKFVRKEIVHFLKNKIIAKMFMPLENARLRRYIYCTAFI